MSLKARSPRNLKDRAHLRQSAETWQQLQHEQEEDRKEERWELTERELEAMAETYWHEAEPLEEIR